MTILLLFPAPYFLPWKWSLHGGVYVSLLNPAKLGVRLVVGEGDAVVVGCAAAKGCVRAIY